MVYGYSSWSGTSKMGLILEEFLRKILGYEKNFIRHIIDPLHGQIGITELENDVINTNIFERLKNIKQLGFVYNVYPGANHKRYEHSIGTLYVSWTMLKRFLMNYSEQEYHNGPDILNLFENEILDSIRLSALLHDLGHGPFSHSFEKMSGFFDCKLDHDELTGYLLTYDYPDEIINELFDDSDFIKNMKNVDIIDDYRIGLTKYIPRYIRDIILGIYYKSYKLNFYDVTKFEPIRILLHDMIKGDIGSDRIDYLLRDTYFSGLGHRFNFSDLLDNLRGIYDPIDNRLLLAIDTKGRNIIEFIMMTRYYHYRLIAHHVGNIKEELIFLERLKRFFKKQNNEDFFYKSALLDDAVEKSLPSINIDMKNVGIWNLGSIGIDHYRFFFYRIINDFSLRQFYTKKIRENIIRGVNSRFKEKLNNDEFFISFILEKPHIPILHIYLKKYLFKKPKEYEKYSVLLHDHSILIRGLAQTYLEDTALVIYSTDKFYQSIFEFTLNTHHFYIDHNVFRQCLNKIIKTDIDRFDFLLFSLYKITKQGRNYFSGITDLFDEISKIQNEYNLDFYDFKVKDYYDPDYGSFNYPKAKSKDVFLIDDLFIFLISGLIEIKTHLANKKEELARARAEDVDYFTNIYLFYPTIRYREIGLKHIMYPLESALKFYPQEILDKYDIKFP